MKRCRHHSLTSRSSKLLRPVPSLLLLLLAVPSVEAQEGPSETPLPPSWSKGEAAPPLPPSWTDTSPMDVPLPPGWNLGNGTAPNTPNAKAAPLPGDSDLAPKNVEPETPPKTSKDRKKSHTRKSSKNQKEAHRSSSSSKGKSAKSSGKDRAREKPSASVKTHTAHRPPTNPTFARGWDHYFEKEPNSTQSSDNSNAQGDYAPTAERPRLPELVHGPTNFSFRTLFLALFVWLLTSWVRSFRKRTLAHGSLHRVLSTTFHGLRLILFFLVLRLVIGFMPETLEPAFPWIATALAVSIGWTARDIIRDFFAGLFLLFEGRFRPGAFIEGTNFRGTIESVGIRATWLRDSHGYRVSVPNSRILSEVVRSDRSARAEHEVSVRLPEHAKSINVRQALQDAVLTSPWVPCIGKPKILRDPQDPGLWHIRSRILEPNFAGPFEGDLLERIEAYLSHEDADESVPS